MHRSYPMAAASYTPDVKLSMPESEAKICLAQRAQWLRAALLGASDGLLSTTSLMLGVGAAKHDQSLMTVTGIAGAIAGACSMAVGEYVSVSTQRDIEEKSAGLSKSEGAAESVAAVANGEPKRQAFSPAAPPQSSSSMSTPQRTPVMKVIAREAQESRVLSNPYKAACASAVSFLLGSLFPLLSAVVVSESSVRVVVLVAVSSAVLAVSGGVGAYLGGSSVRASAVRVLVGGWISMAVTYGLLKPLDKNDKGGEN